MALIFIYLILLCLFLISPPQCTLGRISPDNVGNHAPGFEYAVIYPVHDLDSTCIRPWYPRAPRPSPVTRTAQRAPTLRALSSHGDSSVFVDSLVSGSQRFISRFNRCDLQTRSEISLYRPRDVRHVELALFKRGHAECCCFPPPASDA